MNLKSFLSAAAILFSVSGVQASTITYTETATVTGALGGNPFANVLATITAVANTSDVTSCGSGCFHNDAITATLNVTGFGTATFTDAVYVFANQPLGVVGITGVSTSIGFPLDIIDTFSPAFAAYGLDQAIGPITNSSNVFFSTFATSSGLFELTAILDNQSTFQASVSATPLPAGLPLFATGLAGLAWLTSRKKLG